MLATQLSSIGRNAALRTVLDSLLDSTLPQAASDASSFEEASGYHGAMRTLLFILAIHILLPNVRCCAQASRAKANLDLDKIVSSAFSVTHDGWSSDEVLVNPELNRKFIEECRRDLANATGKVTEAQLNWKLLNLRKAKKLPAKVTRRSHSKHDAYRHAAEIAARSMEDKHRQNIDRVLCDPKLRSEFDKMASRLAPETKTMLLRKAALGLRKARRLKPEFVARVADWGREITTAPIAKLQANIDTISEGPGVYVFYDSTGYLYVGEAENLRRRLAKHLEDSDRQSLAKYLKEHGRESETISVEIHAFDSDSKARLAAMRRAYESELISSRKPRFNVRP